MRWQVGYVEDWYDLRRAREEQDEEPDGHAGANDVTTCGQRLLTPTAWAARVSCSTCRRAFDDNREALEVLAEPSGVTHSVDAVLTLREPWGLNPPKASRDHRARCLEVGVRLAPHDWVKTPVGTLVNCLACLGRERGDE